MEIFEATVCSFNEREKTNRGYRYSIDVNNYRKTLCIQENDEFIDINNGKSYYKLKKDENGYILKEEFPRIELNVEYITNTKMLKPEEITFIASMKVKAVKMLREGKQKKLKR